jgi:hypothetical protein
VRLALEEGPATTAGDVPAPPDIDDIVRKTRKPLP